MIFSEKKTLQEFTEGVFESEEDQKQLSQHLNKRRVVSHLVAMRAAKGVTQSQIAQQLECKQSTISKLEAGCDSELTLADLEAYAKASGSEMTIVISDRGNGLADQVKMHAGAIRHAFMKLVHLAHKDDAIARGVAELHMQAFQNINKMLAETASKLPACSESGRPFIEVTTIDGSEKRQVLADSRSRRGRKKQESQSRDTPQDSELRTAVD